MFILQNLEILSTFLKAPKMFPHLGGLKVTDLKGMSYNPLTDSWALSGDLTVNYLLKAEKALG